MTLGDLRELVKAHENDPEDTRVIIQCEVMFRDHIDSDGDRDLVAAPVTCLTTADQMIHDKGIMEEYYTYEIIEHGGRVLVWKELEVYDKAEGYWYINLEGKVEQNQAIVLR